MKVGILGSGQLGRMLALAGYPLGLEFEFYDKQAGSPVASLAKVWVGGDTANPELEAFLAQVDVVTYEFEHLDLQLLDYVAARKPMFPGVASNRICQHRVREKRLFSELGVPTAPFRVIETRDDLEQAVAHLGLPLVAKTATQGYDGKGQWVLREAADLERFWPQMDGLLLMVEAFVSFRRELSIVAVRAQDGEIRFYPLTENHHRQGILHYSVAPAEQTQTLQAAAEDYSRRILTALEHVGVLTLELFDTEQGLVANEMAPRVHNSGHWTMDAAECSQFENHLRAVCQLPLGSTAATGPALMLNLVGDPGDVATWLKLDKAHLHLYGKEARPGRKLGHLNLTGDSVEQLKARIADWL